MTGLPSLEEVDARLRSLGANAVVTAEDARAIAHLHLLRIPAVPPVASRAARGRLTRRRLGPFPLMKWPLGWVVFVLLAVGVFLALGAVGVAADTPLAASEASKPISEREAIADAMRQLPNNGAGYKVVATQLEPSSRHFEV